MKKIATTTVIRGNGACEAYMNDIVNKEIAKMNKQHQMELSRQEAELEATRNHRDRLLADKLDSMNNKNAYKESFWQRFKDALEMAWCKFWGITYVLGLWRHNDET